jgi:hypothetical protein
MALYGEQPDSSEPRRDRDVRLDCLLEQWSDQLLTPQELRELNDLLLSDPAARRAYLRYVQLHASLGATLAIGVDGASPSPRPDEAGAQSTCSALLESLPQSEDRAVRRWANRRVGGWLAVAASIAVVALAALLWLDRGDDRAPSPQDRATVAGTFPDRRGADDAQLAGDGAQVARVTYLSPSVEWDDGNNSIALHSPLSAGQTIELVRGEVRLEYDSGVQLRLLGPAVFIARADGGNLHRGGLRAVVSEAGRGFTIDTPNGKVVDFGTEFGVAVDDFGVAEVSVFQGIVDAFPAVVGGAATKPIRLTQGQAVLWNREKLIHLDADPQRFESREPASPPEHDAASRVLDEDLRTSPLAADRWTTHGDFVQSPAGLVLRGDGSHANLPYLVSSEQFDPSRRPVTVICDVRFANFDPQTPPSFAVLTRSSAERDAHARVGWNTMHTCVRSSLKSQDFTLSGMLEAATKLDRECPLSNIVWRGFHKLGEDVPYRLVMTDDGVNVSFTVSLVADPSVRKTIAFRSLFRSKQNHIVLEGSPGGSVVVERIQVYQGPDRDAESEPLENTSAPAKDAAAALAQSAIDARLLDELAPADGELRISENFDGPALDNETWATLGDATIVDGRLQLGLPNADEHINTWANRPYLLTKQSFTPADGRLTILGTIEFARNFLHEYGGSYAVMTRADNKLGSGPGWEYSVLQSGVRLNFWPSAWGHEHSLEIHEKPSPGMLSLLVAEGLEINPEARGYLFKVVDDGQTVTLTILDRSDPSIQKTVTARTVPTLRNGIIGFESCWGCPVWLDDVRIFVSRANARGD